jgi:hypothetical protein
MSSKLSRRAIVAGASALTAGSAAVINPAAAAGGCSYPDLAREFAAIYERVIDRSRRDHAALKRFDSRVFEVTGLTRDQWPWPFGRDPEFECDPEFDRLVKKIQSENADPEPTDEHGCSIELNEIDDVLDPLVEKILGLPVHNVADLALQARVVALANCEFDVPVGFFTLLENIGKLAGIEIEAMPRDVADDEAAAVHS